MDIATGVDTTRAEPELALPWDLVAMLVGIIAGLGILVAMWS